MTSAYMPDVQVQVAWTSGYATPAGERVWTDVSAYVELDRGIEITHGRTDERGACDANTMNLTLDNRDGRFTAGLSSSPYYPNVKLGRPIRVLSTQVGGPSVANPYFEVGVASWSAQGGSLFGRSTSQAWEGASSGRITWPAGVAGASWVQTTMSNLIAGVTYRVAVMAYVLPGHPAMGLNFGAATSADPDSVTLVEDTWTEMELIFTATATSHLLKVFTAEAATVGQLGYIDAISFASTRFLGYVDRWPVEWDEGVDASAQAPVSASSRMARLGLSDPLKSIVEQEWSVDSPLALYPLGEPEGATAVSDVSGNLAPPLVLGGPGTPVVFGDATGPGTDSLTAGLFDVDGQYLQAYYDNIFPPGTTEATVECYMLAENDAFTSTYALRISNTANPDIRLYLGIAAQNATALSYDGGSPLGSMITSGTTDVADNRTHHIAATISGTTLTLYVDGVVVDTDTDADWGPAFPNFNRIRVGVSDGDPGNTYTFVVSHVAFHDTALSADRLAAHAGAGVDGFAGETAAERLTRYAGYAGIPIDEQDIDAGATTPIQHIDTTDKTVLSLSHTVEETEGGVLFDAPDNKFTYVGRVARYGAAPAFTLDMSLQQVEAGIRPNMDRTNLVNDVTAMTPDGVGVRVVNQASVDDYGRHSPGGDLELVTTDPNHAEAAAHWLVGMYGEPRPRVPALSVDVLTLPPATQVACLNARVSTRLDVLNWPAQVGSTYDAGFFVEGYSESFGPESHTLSFNVSPAELFDVFVLDDATYGVLDGPYPLAY